MMAELVRDDIVLCEVALGAEPGGQFVEKAGVEIDVVVRWAIERPHCRLGCAAARGAATRIEA